VCYHARRDFFEDAIRYCVADEAANINFVQIDSFGDFGVRGGLIDGEGFGCSVVSPISPPIHKEIQLPMP
jgi:hypothetical protein